MLLSDKPFRTIELYRLLFHVTALGLILGMPMLLRSEAEIPKRISSNNVFFYRWIFVSAVTAILYFLNAYVFVPIYLKHGRYLKYAIVLIASIFILTFAVQLFVEMMNLDQLRTHLNDRLLPGPGAGRGRVIRIGFSPMFPMLISLALGISFEMILNWEVQRKEKAQIEREKMASELSFLKSQVNPHFLFNSLNTIYALSEQNSPKTGEAVLVLSNLMRYTLYGSNNGKTDINKEIECIENYIVLQKMRLPSREDIVITFNVEENNSKNLVEPMILIPFVENAFKHGLSYNQRSEVRIVLHIQNNFLNFHVRNTKKGGGDTGSPKAESGIGLVNIRRRLDLLYHRKHSLVLDDSSEHFDIRLTIDLA